MICFQNIEYEKGRKVILPWRNLKNTTSTKWSMWTSTVISHVDSIYLLIWDMGYVENGTSTPVFFPKTHKPSLIMRNPSWETFYKMTNILQNYQGHEN